MVSQETAPGGTVINTKRQAEELPPLKILIVSLVKPPTANTLDAAAPESKVSSTDFRARIAGQVTEEQFGTIRECWFSATKDLPQEFATVWFWKLVQLYSESWRKYHNLQHIFELISKISDVRKNYEREGITGLVSAEEHFLILTAFFHDAIYTPTSKLNEKVSENLKAEKRSIMGEVCGRLSSILGLEVSNPHQNSRFFSSALVV